MIDIVCTRMYGMNIDTYPGSLPSNHSDITIVVSLLGHNDLSKHQLPVAQAIM